MSYDKRKDTAVVKDSLITAVVKKKERIVVFMRDFKVVTSYAINSMNKHIQSYRAGQIFFDDAKIDALLAAGAPMSLYIRDDEQPTTSGSN